LKLGLGLLTFMIVGLVAIPIVSPNLGAAVADGLRSIVGPEPVAAVESLSFQIQDAVNRARYQLSGGQPQIAWADPSAALSTPIAIATPQVLIVPAPPSGQSPPTMRQMAAKTSLPSLNVVDALPQVDGSWQSFGPLVAGQPVMARASVKPDPGRPYAQAALVRIDLSQADLHVVPGVSEPAAALDVPSFPRPGKIPIEVQTGGKLLAAFNGGFKAVNGNYGMMTEEGIVVRPALDGIATIALYRDGRVRLGAWGRDITMTTDLVAFRQNCPLLIDAGQLNPAVNDGNFKAWGTTIRNTDASWRSGLGISRDGRFLIYTAGDALTVEALARALQQAGAEYAMQLDINSLYTRFVTFRASGAQNSAHPLVAQKLIDQMPGIGETVFLAPYDRDFFYVTAHDG
jgi:hypothetical protein